MREAGQPGPGGGVRAAHTIVPHLQDEDADPAIRQWHFRAMDEEQASAWIDHWPGRWHDETGAGWAVTEGAAVTGQISFRRLRLADGFAEISYWVLPAARGRRLASRALSALTDWAFGTLGLHRIALTHSTANPASCRVAETTGFRYEGTMRREARHIDGWHDMHLHVRLGDD
ncbi:GNAT family N-acetyltransferase [Actinoplanes sp. NPDC048988]|uniref:GNAT family N-acetyltransferase n=1 Tax=Actinoplanes sp. NPDC048988 TaxID=3363901 RepID=UPI003713BA52